MNRLDPAAQTENPDRAEPNVALVLLENQDVRDLIGALREFDMPGGTNRFQHLIDVLVEIGTRQRAFYD